MYDYTRTTSKEKVMEELRLIPDLKNVALMVEEKILVEGYVDKSYFVNSGEHKGKLLFVETQKANSGDTFARISDFFVEMANAELAKLYEADIEVFSKIGAEKLGHILTKRGIDDPQKWFEARMRMNDEKRAEPPYSYCINMLGTMVACCKPGEGQGVIQFSSLTVIQDKFTRIHEMVHKISTELTDLIWGTATKHQLLKAFPIGRMGLSFMNVKKNKNTGKNHYSSVQFGVALNHYSSVQFGVALNEGVTNLITSILTGIDWRNEKVYLVETMVAQGVTKLVGADTLYEAVLFDPKILEQKFNSIFHNKHAYSLLVTGLKQYALFNSIYKQALSKLLYYGELSMRGVKRLFKTKEKKVLFEQNSSAPEVILVQSAESTREVLQMAHKKTEEQSKQRQKNGVKTERGIIDVLEDF